MFMHVLEYLEKTAQTAETGKVMDEFQEMTYPQLLQISRKVGSALSDKNILNQPVAVLLEKSVDALSAERKTFSNAVGAASPLCHNR